jgi:predicted dehydrogenase/threonine dehydrogenase-like Zn-dependent dehydrogenase
LKYWKQYIEKKLLLDDSIMLQLTQNLRNGKMEIQEVPLPACTKGHILLQNYYSVISAGTEGKTVKDAHLGYMGKAMARQKEVKLVIDSIKTQGIFQTYNSVMNKLDTPSALGYSCAGKVIQVTDDIKEFKVGDLVACGGAGAVHSEVVSVPTNLCVRVLSNVDIKYASITTIAAIAMQGIRQADLKLGEYCVVIGLGLIGQLTMQLLNCGGILAIGIDISEKKVELANNIIPGSSFLRSNVALEKIITEFTNGFGADTVIITAASSSIDPVELAGRICRQKGKVVIVGAVPTGFSREYYYKKELELRMSCSYGPGRYDNNYEEKGIDYPIGYVRWTENRNMQAFVNLLAKGKLNIEPLMTHVYDFENAPKAYDMILEKEEAFVGILLKYNAEKKIKRTFSRKDLIGEKVAMNQKPAVTVGFIGAGSFAQNFLLPNLKGKVELIGVATMRGNTARNIADKYDFYYATGDANEIIRDDKINTVFIATRHNLHAEYVIKAIEAGKNVFVEKPLSITEFKVDEIKSSFLNKNKPLKLMIGYNRRFAPTIVKMKSELNNELPKAINYRINAGNILKEHWIHDTEIGGGRIIGEVCHFIDLCIFIADDLIDSLSAEVLECAPQLNDSLIINLKFQNGSVASISYFSNGSKLMPKEYLEVFCGGTSFIMDDFRELKIFGAKNKKFKMRKQDKGHAEEVKQFVDSIKIDKALIPFEQLYQSTLATFKIIESIKNRCVIKL